MLKPDQTYYYVYRHQYVDGHVSMVSQPKIIRTDLTQRKADLDIVVSEDLHSKPTDVKYARVEIYRKEGDTPFRHIETVDPNQETVLGTEIKFIEYVDDGKLEGNDLDDLEIVYTEKHGTQTEMEDRIIRGDLVYPERSVNFPRLFNIETVDVAVEEGNPTLPTNATVQLYAKVVFPDGQDSFHMPVSNELQNIERDKTLKLNPIPDVSGDFDGSFQVVALFLRVQKDPNINEEDKLTIPFNSIEINNQNVQTLASSQTELPFFNNRPQIFLGFKFFKRVFANYGFNSTSGNWTAKYFDIIRDEDFQRIENVNINDFIIVDEVDVFIPDTGSGNFIDAVEASEFVPDFLEKSFVEQQPLTYSRHAHIIVDDDHEDNAFHNAPPDGFLYEYVYKLSFADSLERAVRVADVKVRLKNLVNLSTQVDSSDFVDFEETVDSVVDTSFSADVRATDHGHLLIPPSSRIYLVLPFDSIYSRIDRRGINNQDTVGNYDRFDFDPDILRGDEFIRTDGGLTPRFNFELVGVDFELPDPTGSEIDQIAVPGSETLFQDTFDLHVGLEANTIFDSTEADEFINDNLIYIGSYYDQTTFTQNFLFNGRFKHTGFEYVQEESLIFPRLLESNVIERLLLEEDLKLLEEEFPNQLVWSEKTVVGSNRSGARKYLFTSFLDVPTEYGKIIKLASHRNTLLIFCERAVAVSQAGGQLAQNDSGDIFIKSSQFLHNPQWILKSVPHIQYNSIVEFEKMVIFSDTRDVWMFDGQMQNLTNGSIEIGDTCVGMIDPRNKEYRLTVFEGLDNTDNQNSVSIPIPQGVTAKTYAYSFELGEWMGPYTYGNVVGQHFADELMAFRNDQYNLHNQGNDFGGDQFVTEITSTANTLDAPTQLKRYRKLYVDTESPNLGLLELHYDSKYFENPYIVDLTQKTKINGRYKIGIKPGTGRSNNSRSFFWKIRSVVEGFFLRSIGFDYLVKRR